MVYIVEALDESISSGCIYSHTNLSFHVRWQTPEECNEIYEEIISIRVEDPLNILINQRFVSFPVSKWRVCRISIKDPLKQQTVMAQWNQL